MNKAWFDNTLEIDLDSEIIVHTLPDSQSGGYIAVAKTTNQAPDYWVCYINGSDFVEVPMLNSTEIKYWLKDAGLNQDQLCDLVSDYQIWD